MIKEMLDELELLKKDSIAINEQASCLLNDNKTKVYRPLLTRMTCGESKLKY